MASCLETESVSSHEACILSYQHGVDLVAVNVNVVAGCSGN